MSDGLLAVIILILFFAGALGFALLMAYIRVLCDKSAFSKTPLKLIEKLELDQSKDKYLFAYRKMGWWRSEAIVKNHLGEVVGTIKFKITTTKGEILIGDKVYIDENINGKYFRKGAILYESTATVGNKVIAKQECAMTDLGEINYELEGDRKLKILGSGAAVINFRKIHDIHEDGKIIGNIFYRYGVFFLNLPNDIGIVDKIFIISREMGRFF